MPYCCRQGSLPNELPGVGPYFVNNHLGDKAMAKRSFRPKTIRACFWLALILIFTYTAFGQSLTAGTVAGTVTEANNAVVPNASVTIENTVTGYKQTVVTGTDGTFRFNNVPLNNYVFDASAPGFTGAHGSINVRTSVPITLNIPLAVSGTYESVTVT